MRIAPVAMLPGESLGAYHAIDSDERARRTDTAWARQQVESFPLSWAGVLMKKWGKGYGKVEEARTKSNAAHLKSCSNIARALRAGLRADANDAEVREAAKQSARDMARRLDWIPRLLVVDDNRSEDQAQRLVVLGKIIEARHLLGMRGLGEFFPIRVQAVQSILKRLCDDRWWRRVLRKVLAQAVEGTARTIGLVHKRAGCYVSDDSLNRRKGQITRNEAILKSVHAVNEHGQDYTLAELAAKGPANREIRRHELMTRIAGFELIAKQCEHEAFFVTVTCPSRMHAYRTKGNGFGVEANPKFGKQGDVLGEMLAIHPDEAQRYLSKQWSKARAAADRAGLHWYGFRITEPNHDGTPHWHCLLFFPKLAMGRGSEVGEASASGCGSVACAKRSYRLAVRILRRYFLWADSADERGARKHRVKVERIDWARGSAAGYIAKYVAKNIDGYRVEKDLYGNDAISSSQRVDAWASTWRIRQFQQIGGAPVGIWRELRRLNQHQGASSAGIGLAIDAANITAVANKADDTHDLERVLNAADGWATYLELQGGTRVRRDELRVCLLRELTGEIGVYGDVLPPKTIGVQTVDVRRVCSNAFLGNLGLEPGQVYRHATRRVTVEVETERCSWTIVSGATALERAKQGITTTEALAREVAGAALEGQAGADRLPPWSPVNNCTRDGLDRHPAPLVGPAVERHRKIGRTTNWAARRKPKRTGGGATGEHDEHTSNTVGRRTPADRGYRDAAAEREHRFQQPDDPGFGAQSHHGSAAHDRGPAARDCRSAW